MADVLEVRSAEAQIYFPCILLIIWEQFERFVDW